MSVYRQARHYRDDARARRYLMKLYDVTNIDVEVEDKIPEKL